MIRRAQSARPTRMGGWVGVCRVGRVRWGGWGRVGGVRGEGGARGGGGGVRRGGGGWGAGGGGGVGEVRHRSAKASAERESGVGRIGRVGRVGRLGQGGPDPGARRLQPSARS